MKPLVDYKRVSLCSYLCNTSSNDIEQAYINSGKKKHRNLSGWMMDDNNHVNTTLSCRLC